MICRERKNTTQSSLRALRALRRTACGLPWAVGLKLRFFAHPCRMREE